MNQEYQGGSYVIINVTKKKYYFGGTGDFKQRWANHRSQLKHNKHSQHHDAQIQADYNDGNEFVFEPLIYVAPEKVHEIDQATLDIAFEMADHGELYNVHQKAKGGDGPTQESSKKQAAAIAKTYEGFVSPTGQPVTIINLTTFCRDNGLDQSAMWRVYNGLGNHHKGWTCSR